MAYEVLYGSSPQAGYGAYGGVPQAANPQATQQQSIQGNIAALPGMENLASGVNKFQQDQLNAQYSGLNPNFMGSYGQAGTNIAQQLRGEVPYDVVRQLQQNAAEFGVRGGISGSRLQGYQGLRALGLTSIGQQNQGQQNLLSLTAGTPIARPYDITQQFVSPEQQQAAQQHANNLAAAPNPGASAANALALAQQGQQYGQGGGRGATGGVSIDPTGTGRAKASQNSLGDIMNRYSGGGNQSGVWQQGTGSTSGVTSGGYNRGQDAQLAVNNGEDWWNTASGMGGNFGGGLNYGVRNGYQDPYATGSSGTDWSNPYSYGTPSSSGGGYGPSYDTGAGAGNGWDASSIDWSQYE